MILATFVWISGNYQQNNALVTTDMQINEMSTKFPIKTFTASCELNYNVILIKLLQQNFSYNYVKSWSNHLPPQTGESKEEIKAT